MTRATAAAPDLAARLNAVSLPTERGWVVSADNGLTMSRMVRGVAERYALDAPALAELAQRFDERVIAEAISAIHGAGAGGDLDDVQSFLMVGFCPLPRALTRGQFRNEGAVGFGFESRTKCGKNRCALRIQ